MCTNQLLKIFKLTIGPQEKALLIFPPSQSQDSTVFVTSGEVRPGNIMLPVKDDLNLKVLTCARKRCTATIYLLLVLS